MQAVLTGTQVSCSSQHVCACAVFQPPPPYRLPADLYRWVDAGYDAGALLTHSLVACVARSLLDYSSQPYIQSWSLLGWPSILKRADIYGNYLNVGYTYTTDA